MIGRTLGHYEIVALIGRGGMGEVYRARDTKLDRDVALKVLPRDVARDPVRLERFLREAKMVAGLNHPHIVTLHSVEEAGGAHFLVMELVDGQPLDVALQSDEPIAIKKVIEVGVAVADALAAAHEKGIIHRDLKPANVMITRDGRAKVLDFGIAKTAPLDLGATQTGAPLTRDGVVMGTLPYMSPEQVRGGRVDSRSDIFSLGTMLYQLTTGALPFHGDYDHAIGYAIVNTSPRPIPELRSDVPAALVAIIDKCLAKDPAQRYGSAAVVRDELHALQTQTGHRVATATQRYGRRAWIGIAALALVVGVAAYYLLLRHSTPAQTKSIAVLPFLNMSGDATQDYFSDGISEELLNLLAQIPQLKVAARTSSFSFKGKEVEVPEIGRRLNVTHVLEGSVRKSGDRVRITAQLVQTADGFHVWSQTYDRKLDDVFTMQDEIAADVVKELKVTFLGETPKARITDPQAYALFLQARDLARQLSPRSLALSDSLYQISLAIDSTYAPAWVGLSANYVNEISFGNMKATEGFRRSRHAALKALKFDPDNGLAYSRLGIIAMWSDNDLDAAAKHFEKGLALDPNDATLLMNTGQFLLLIGRMEEEMTVLGRALALDPVNVNLLQNAGICEINNGQIDDGIAKLRTGLDLNPGLAVMHYAIGLGYVLKGDPNSALHEMQLEEEDFRRCGLPIVYHALGRKADSDAALTELITKDADLAAYNIAQCYAFRGEKDHAFEWLERAWVSQDPGLNGMLYDDLLDSLHADPRWSAFLTKIGRSPEQLQKIEFKIPPPSGAGKVTS
ncbi:MAG TPA: protein kinase [Candidatus Krumholzibacteria bacterium]|nr:protein kinase [Candidatus Krumholzibacteria bacterium]